MSGRPRGDNWAWLFFDVGGEEIVCTFVGDSGEKCGHKLAKHIGNGMAHLRSKHGRLSRQQQFVEDNRALILPHGHEPQRSSQHSQLHCSQPPHSHTQHSQPQQSQSHQAEPQQSEQSSPPRRLNRQQQFVEQNRELILPDGQRRETKRPPEENSTVWSPHQSKPYVLKRHRGR